MTEITGCGNSAEVVNATELKFNKEFQKKLAEFEKGWPAAPRVLTAAPKFSRFVRPQGRKRRNDPGRSPRRPDP